MSAAHHKTRHRPANATSCLALASLLQVGCAQGASGTGGVGFTTAATSGHGTSASGGGGSSSDTSGADTGTGGTGSCGDGVKDPGEACDGTDLGGQSCVDLGLPGGTLGCAPDCASLDTSTCDAPASCGDGVKDPGEACDGADLGSVTCMSQGFPGGALTCLGNCSGFDTSGCDPNPACGDGVKNGAETCDGADLGGQSCMTQGFPGGALACLTNCSGFDTSGCDPNPACGDGVKNGVEACDGADLGGESCVTQGFPGGTLTCLGNCSGFDTSGCAPNPFCGDGVKNGTETCDGADLGGQSCTSQGFDGGTLACLGNCSGFDTSGCTTNPVCGNNTQEMGEVCDGTDLAGQSCTSQGFDGGTLACLGNCSGFDTSGCTMNPVCGNNVQEAGETCDGTDLAGKTCSDFDGYEGNGLACKPDCGGYDLSDCNTCGKTWDFCWVDSDCCSGWCEWELNQCF